MQSLWYTKQPTPVSPRQTTYLLGLQQFCQCTVATYPRITTVKPLVPLGSWLFLGLSVKTLGGGDLREGLCPPHAIRMFWHWYKQSHPPTASVPLWNTPTVPMLRHRANACSLYTIIYIMPSMLWLCWSGGLAMLIRRPCNADPAVCRRLAGALAMLYHWEPLLNSNILI